MVSWIRKGWGSEYQSKYSTTLPYHMDFTGMVDTKQPPIEVAVDAVKKISEEYPGPYYLFVSGGVDSQAMLCAWQQSGVPFTAISIIYLGKDKQPLNGADIETLNSFTEQNGIKIQFKTLNLIDFFENELSVYAHRYQCISPQICTHMKISELVEDGTVIFSGNYFHDKPFFDFTILGLDRYANLSGRSVIPFFFLHTKELAGTFQVFASAINNSNKRLDPYAFKCSVYTAGGFKIIPQHFKMTGFEQVKEYYDQFPEMVSPKERLSFAKYPSRRIFDLVFRYRFTLTIKYVEQIVVKLKQKA